MASRRRDPIRFREGTDSAPAPRLSQLPVRRRRRRRTWKPGGGGSNPGPAANCSRSLTEPASRGWETTGGCRRWTENLLDLPAWA